MPKAKPKGRPRMIYNSMAQAAAALGVSIDAIKYAKGKGCDAIRGNGSVNSEKLLAWISANPAEPGAADGVENLRDQKTREEIRKLKQGNDERDGILIPKATITEEIRKVVAQACDILDNTLVNEAPPMIASHEDVPNAREQIRKHVDRAKQKIQKLSKLFSE